MARMMDAGQVHMWDSQRMAVNYISQMLIKAKSTRIHTSSGASIYSVVLPTYIPLEYL